MFVSARMPIGRSRSFKVIDFGTNRKRVCDFLIAVTLVLSCLVSDCEIAGFLLRNGHLPLFYPILGGIPVSQDDVGVSPSQNPTPISREIISEVFQFPTNLFTINYVNTSLKRHRQTDGRTTYCGIVALRVASRGKAIAERLKEIQLSRPK